MALPDIRKQIDEIDDRVAELFTARMALAAQVAETKAQSSTAVRDPARERAILSRVSAGAKEPVSGYMRVLFSTLFDLSRSYQNQLILRNTDLSRQIEAALAQTPELFPKGGVVACQGVEGAYSQIACEKLFKTPDILFFKNFEGVFQAVQSGMCEFGILPIENSFYGSVDEVYDLMRSHRFHIVRRLKLHISHALLAKPGTKLENIREIVSHEQALGQCSRYCKGLKDVKITVCENTAAAARLVAESPRTDLAAISSKNCAELYGLIPLDLNVQNSDNNYTRFICISKKMMIFPGADKMSLMLSVAHSPGALYSMISKFSVLGLNLTKIESRPIPGTDFEFMFYFDLDASVRAPEVSALLNELAGAPELFVFLGNYSEQ